MIRKATHQDSIDCLNIAKGLPEWFNEKGIQEIADDLINLPTYVYDEDGILGFACIQEKSDKTAEIKQLAVKKMNHRLGIGTRLVRYLEKEIIPNKIIEVKTLDESCDYEPYKETRAFYKKNSFTKIEVIDPYPGWDKGNPCAIYVKAPPNKIK